MNYLSFILAYRFARGIPTHAGLSLLTYINAISIFLGSFCLTLAVMVMGGFENATYQKLQGVHAQITVEAGGQPLNIGAIESVLRQEFPEIESMAPTTFSQILLHNAHTNKHSAVITLKAIEPRQEFATTTLLENLKLANANSAQTVFKKHTLVIGFKLAEQLALQKGDMISLLFLQDTSDTTNALSFAKKDVTVVDFFNTGIEEFDGGFALCSLETYSDLFDTDSVTHCVIKLSSEWHHTEKSVIEKLKKRLNLQVYSWKNLYPSLVAVLHLEKCAMIFIMSLLLLIASIATIALLTVQNITRQKEIALLIALGMPFKSVADIFYVFGIFLSFCATLLGIIVAIGIGQLLIRYPIPLPDSYYVTHIPIQQNYGAYLGIFVLSMMISYGAIWLASRKLYTFNCAQTLRFEV